jgi:hypothetical protein
MVKNRHGFQKIEASQHPIAHAVARVWRGGAKHPGGSGFLIANGIVCTCTHVLCAEYEEIPSGAYTINFPFVDGRQSTAELSYWLPIGNKGGDVAFLAVEQAGAQVELLLDTNSIIGTPCEVYGFPQGFDLGVWASSCVVGNKDARGWFEITTEREHSRSVKRGFSGAPVWDKVRQGIIGMIVAVDNDPSMRVGFMIPTESLAHAHPNGLPVAGSSTIGLIGPQSSTRFSLAAERLKSPELIVRYLEHLNATRIDPRERYWLYLTLGCVGGPLARETLEHAKQHETDPFASMGISEALARQHDCEWGAGDGLV